MSDTRSQSNKSLETRQTPRLRTEPQSSPLFKMLAKSPQRNHDYVHSSKNSILERISRTPRETLGEPSETIIQNTLSYHPDQGSPRTLLRGGSPESSFPLVFSVSLLHPLNIPYWLRVPTCSKETPNLVPGSHERIQQRAHLTYLEKLAVDQTFDVIRIRSRIPKART